MARFREGVSPFTVLESQPKQVLDCRDFGR